MVKRLVLIAFVLAERQPGGVFPRMPVAIKEYDLQSNFHDYQQILAWK